MKIMHVAGSPRKKSASTAIADQFCEMACEADATVDVFVLNEMNFKGCQGCFACKQGKDRCIVKDDLAPVLEGLYDTDVLIISTPVYFWDLPGQLKCFIDRLFSLAKDDWQTNSEPSRLSKGKQLVFIQTQGSDEKNHADIFEKYALIFKSFCGFAECHLLRACNNITSQYAQSQTTIKERTVELIRRLFASAEPSVMTFRSMGRSSYLRE